ncbi:hypothetical protein NDU88_002028 [Pleurodeles waltl]|uniref:Uncharacterized protein n=1 Tax=Pleurodeles waltl TaxID=8319 RepID=A0AAV7M708_PLEWA|nr:hypothetical protein NDU88_002028 [Pleurodeles waltl]
MPAYVGGGTQAKRRPESRKRTLCERRRKTPSERRKATLPENRRRARPENRGERGLRGGEENGRKGGTGEQGRRRDEKRLMRKKGETPEEPAKRRNDKVPRVRTQIPATSPEGRGYPSFVLFLYKTITSPTDQLTYLSNSYFPHDRALIFSPKNGTTWEKRREGEQSERLS